MAFLHPPRPQPLRNRLAPRLMVKAPIKSAIPVPPQGVSVTLDRPALAPKAFFGLADSVQTLKVAFVLTALVLLLPRIPLVRAIYKAVINKISQLDQLCRKELGWYARLVFRTRMLVGALRRYLWEERFRRIWQQYFVKPPKIIRARDYPLPCTLEERVVVGGTGTFVLYRFRFPQSDQTMGLDLGQHVDITSTDSDDRLVRGGFIPVTDIFTPGYFDIVVERHTTDEPFARILDKLAIGDTVMVSPGRRLANNHPGPINRLVVVANKLGVIPALQFARQLLPHSETMVSKAMLIWLNDEKDHFLQLATDRLEDLFFTYDERLDVQTFLVPNLYSPVPLDDPQYRLKRAVPDPEPDTLVLVAGPEYFVKKAVTFLTEVKGFPETSVIAV